MMGAHSVDRDRLWRSMMDLAAIGATEAGGVRRLALTPEDGLGRAWFVRAAEAAGLVVRQDAIGNLFARRTGAKPTLAPILVGSHLDTQPTGGKFDGAFGVLAGLEVARRLDEIGVPAERSLEIVAWTNEEGSRFLPVMAGSGVFCGVHRLETVRDQLDLDGVAFGRALRDIGAEGSATPGFDVDAYFEAHIEQGPILEDAGVTIGVVTGALGQRWFDCTLTGFEGHAGPTPMVMRRDALQGAAAAILAIDAIGRMSPESRSTVGQILCWPNSRNTIPGQVRFSIDLRHPEDSGLDAMESALRARLEDMGRDRALAWSLEPTNAWPACRFDPHCVDQVRSAAVALGLSRRDMVSGAGHDAVNLARIAPTAMIFVPCRGGVSHNEAEEASAEDLAAGASVLLGAVIARLQPAMQKGTS